VAAAWVVLVPLIGAMAALSSAPRRLGAPVGVVTAVATTAAVAALTVTVVRHGTQRHALGGWQPPLGIELVADALAVSFLALTAAVGLLVSCYAVSYYRADRSRWSPGEVFWPVWLFLWAGLNAIYVSGDVFNLYVGLEVMGIAAIILLVTPGGATVLRAGLRYLLAAVLGSLAYLMGVALLYAAHDTVSLQLLAQRVDAGAPTTMALALMTVGLALKTALFPLHFWLPAAHASAAAPVSAVLSALVVKASYYLVLRLWLDVFDQVAAPAGALLLGVLGALAIGWGSVQAFAQQRLKLLVAYSTVSQIGYLFLVFPLIAPGAGGAGVAGTAVAGAVYQALSHALAKAALFLAAGTIMARLGHDTIAGMRGLGDHLPISIAAMGVAAFTLIGLPPSGGFAGKWFLLSAALGSGQWWWVPVILAGGLASAAYLFRALRITLGDRGDGPIPTPGPRHLEWIPFALAAASVAVGFRTTDVVRFLAGV
jgi:formate hydrogenlyase subunit 3/multisubunit Na+/H+ antiporter MnhD subunit